MGFGAGILYASIDVCLLIAAGALVFGLPDESTDVPSPTSPVGRFGTIVGALAMLRGAWHLIGLPAMFMFLTNANANANVSDDSSSRFQMFAIAAIATTVALLVVGFLLAQRKLVERLTGPFVKDTLSELAVSLWGLRVAIAVGAFVCAALSVAPYFSLMR